jgi:hypothetical protein
MGRKKGGKLERRDVTICHRDNYLFIAIPGVCCLLRYPKGIYKEAGALVPGECR